MGYIAINVNEDDLLNGSGIFVKAGMDFRRGEFVFHLFEEDYRSGVLVRGFRVNGVLIAHTWTDDSGDYRAHEYPSATIGPDESGDDLYGNTRRIDVEMYGGTKEQYEHRRTLHERFCEAQGWEQAQFSHHPAWGT